MTSTCSGRTTRARLRGLAPPALDAAAWTLAAVLVTRRPPSLTVAEVAWPHVLAFAGLSATVALLVGLALGLYGHRFPRGSFDEAQALLGVAVVAGTVMLGLTTLGVPVSVPLGAALLTPTVALVLLAALRGVGRRRRDLLRRRSCREAERVLVYGAGEAGACMVTLMLESPRCGFLPVALLDDDPGTHRQRLRGLSVVGGRTELARAAVQHRASAVLLAMPSADAEVIRTLSRTCAEAGLEVYVLPGLRDLVTGGPRLEDIRPLSEQDLLGREPVDIDLAAVAGYLTGRRVLVTGAGGSIGSELCRQVSRLGPAELVMLDRDESALHGVQLSISGHALLDTPDLVVADVRDAARMAAVLRQHRPQVIFHAAALKHLPLLEMHPGEAVKTNAWGTLSLLELAAAFEVGTFVNISTDKAADPTSVLGYSKRIAERSTASVAGRTGRRFLSVRFGNVVGSRGSVLLTFRQQIADGGPVTVTDPEITRYFMTVEEAVRLVVQAGALGGPGETLVLDMGTPVRIADVARRLIEASGRPIELVYTGLRHGEKLHEDLVGSAEALERTEHPMVMATRVPPLGSEAVLALDPESPELVRQMCALCEDRPYVVDQRKAEQLVIP